MKTALYEKKFKKTLIERKLVRLIKNTISQSLFFTQRGIRFTNRYNVAVFLSISMISLHFSAMACISSDYSTCVGFTMNCQKMLIQITFNTKEYGISDHQRNRETKRP